MKKVPVPRVVTTLEAPESPLPAQIQEALGELVGAAKEGLLALSVGRRARRRARADGARGRRGRRPEGQAQPGAHGEASRPRGRVDDARRSARRGPPPADAHGRRRARAAGADLRVLRRPRPAHAGGDGPDARRRLDAQVRGRRRAGRRGRRDREQRRRRRRRCRRCSSSAPATALGGADVAAARRRAPGGDDARRAGDRRRARTSSRSGSPPRASRSRSGCGRARPRTRRSRARCSPTSSTAAWIPSRRSCS